MVSSLHTGWNIQWSWKESRQLQNSNESRSEESKLRIRKDWKKEKRKRRPDSEVQSSTLHCMEKVDRQNLVPQLDKKGDVREYTYIRPARVCGVLWWYRKYTIIQYIDSHTELLYRRLEWLKWKCGYGSVHICQEKLDKYNCGEGTKWALIGPCAVHLPHPCTHS